MRSAVVVLGLPYPNAADPELAARMAFLDSQKAMLPDLSLSSLDQVPNQAALRQLADGQPAPDLLFLAGLQRWLSRGKLQGPARLI